MKSGPSAYTLTKLVVLCSLGLWFIKYVLQNYLSVIYLPTIDSWTTAWVCLYTGFFNNYRVGLLYPQALYLRIQLVVDEKQYFRSPVGNLHIWRANVRTVLCYLIERTWASADLGVHRNVINPLSRYQGTPGESKVTQRFNCAGSASLALILFNGQLYIYLFNLLFTTTFFLSSWKYVWYEKPTPWEK